MTREIKIVLKKELAIGKNEDGSSKVISELALREPTAGDLRGLSFKKLGELDVDTLTALISRTSRPSLSPALVSSMGLAVFNQITEEYKGKPWGKEGCEGKEREGVKLIPY